jgi:hypothetical protein
MRSGESAATRRATARATSVPSAPSPTAHTTAARPGAAGERNASLATGRGGGAARGGPYARAATPASSATARIAGSRRPEPKRMPASSSPHRGGVYRHPVVRRRRSPIDCTRRGDLNPAAGGWKLHRADHVMSNDATLLARGACREATGHLMLRSRFSLRSRSNRGWTTRAYEAPRPSRGPRPTRAAQPPLREPIVRATWLRGATRTWPRRGTAAASPASQSVSRPLRSRSRRPGPLRHRRRRPGRSG